MCIEGKPGCVLVETTTFFLCAEISHIYPLIHYAKPSERLYNINRYMHIYVYIMTSKTKRAVNNIVQY